MSDAEGATTHDVRRAARVRRAAELHAEAAAALLEAAVELEGALMAADPDARRRAGERYDERRLHEARCLTDSVRDHRAHALPLLSVLADPTVSCDPDSSVLASIAEYAAAKPASAGLDVRSAAMEGDDHE